MLRSGVDDHCPIKTRRYSCIIDMITITIVGVSGETLNSSIRAFSVLIRPCPAAQCMACTPSYCTIFNINCFWYHNHADWLTLAFSVGSTSNLPTSSAMTSGWPLLAAAWIGCVPTCWKEEKKMNFCHSTKSLTMPATVGWILYLMIKQEITSTCPYSAA